MTIDTFINQFIPCAVIGATIYGIGFYRGLTAGILKANNEFRRQRLNDVTGLE